MTATRRSPQLARLPRREVGANARGGLAAERVKLRTSIHRRARDPIPRPFHQLTVPIEFAEQLPPDALFEVTLERDGLRYRLIDRTGA